ncbi:HSF-type DNA-binding-domain-containing protein [Dichotomocladium elegans]|nr:HSF-type DNA-binding-domain-containing protein [Dichotomocladium elegans]
MPDLESSSSSFQMNNDHQHPTAFITKLWDMINDPLTDNLIRWSTGRNTSTVHIQDVSNFSQNILPQYFSHSNWPSFVRQLNIYGFRRIRDEETRSTDQYQFSHEYFQPHQRSNLHLIKRRGQLHVSSSNDSSGSSPVTTPAPTQQHHDHDIRTSGGAAPGNAEIIARIWDRLDEIEAQCAATISETQRLHWIHAQQQELLKSIVELILEVTTTSETMKTLKHLRDRLNQAITLADLQQQNQQQRMSCIVPTFSSSDDDNQQQHQQQQQQQQQLPSITELVKTDTASIDPLLRTTKLPPLHGPP